MGERTLSEIWKISRYFELNGQINLIQAHVFQLPYIKQRETGCFDTKSVQYEHKHSHELTQKNCSLQVSLWFASEQEKHFGWINIVLSLSQVRETIYTLYRNDW